MKVALVHDWLPMMRGAEKVLEAICELFPGADLYTLLHARGKLSPAIERMNINTSFIHKLPFAQKRYRFYLPLMPAAIERFNMSGYELIISSSYCVAKGIKKTKSALHICYCHTPMRYIWDMYDEYFGKEKLGVFRERLFMPFAGYLRKWDVESSKSVDFFIANSKNVKDRIARHYNREAEAIYPPVDTDFFTPLEIPKTLEQEAKSLTGQVPDGLDGDFYLSVNAFSPYKRLDLAIEAFERLKYPLKVIGSGQDEKRLKKIGRTGNIEFLGWRSNEELRDYYRKCKALIFPGEEDFGITPLEAQACGRPVIAYGKGGVSETVKDGVSGVFFKEKTADSLIEAVKKFETMKFNPTAIRENTMPFGREKFKDSMANFIQEKIENRGRLK